MYKVYRRIVYLYMGTGLSTHAAEPLVKASKQTHLTRRRSIFSGLRSPFLADEISVPLACMVTPGEPLPSRMGVYDTPTPGLLEPAAGTSRTGGGLASVSVLRGMRLGAALAVERASGLPPAAGALGAVDDGGPGRGAAGAGALGAPVDAVAGAFDATGTLTAVGAAGAGLGASAGAGAAGLGAATLGAAAGIGSAAAGFANERVRAGGLLARGAGAGPLEEAKVAAGLSVPMAVFEALGAGGSTHVPCTMSSKRTWRVPSCMRHRSTSRSCAPAAAPSHVRLTS